MWWSLLLLIASVLLVAYCFLIETYRTWFLGIKPFSPGGEWQPLLKFSVIVPARNEEKNIQAFLPSLLQQTYPASHYEVIVVNDHSTDGTQKEVERLQQQYDHLRLLNMAEMMPPGSINSYKKKAISLAIDRAGGDWIVTTDADCFVQPGWLHTIHAFIQQQQAIFVAAPVIFTHQGTFLSIFQCLDFLSLQGITAASVHHQFHSMCNGANLAYSKSVFYQVNGFDGVEDIASGDDMLLMQKIAALQPDKVKYLLSADAIVNTLPMPTWKQFINQRIRWASKTGAYKDVKITGVLLTVYLVNVVLFVLIVAGFWQPKLWIGFVGLLALKTIFELRFMKPVAHFYGQEHLLKWFAFMQPLHIAYTIVAGLLGSFGSYSWKGRTVK